MESCPPKVRKTQCEVVADLSPPFVVHRAKVKPVCWPMHGFPAEFARPTYTKDRNVNMFP